MVGGEWTRSSRAASKGGGCFDDARCWSTCAGDARPRERSLRGSAGPCGSRRHRSRTGRKHQGLLPGWLPLAFRPFSIAAVSQRPPPRVCDVPFFPRLGSTRLFRQKKVTTTRHGQRTTIRSQAGASCCAAHLHLPKISLLSTSPRSLPCVIHSSNPPHHAVRAGQNTAHRRRHKRERIQLAETVVCSQGEA